MTASRRSTRLGSTALAALMLGFAVLFFAYYPPLSGIQDEVGFVNQALVWSRGSVSAEGAGYRDLMDFGLRRGLHVPMRHPGRSLVALPFLIMGGPEALFASGLVLHLAMTAIGAILLMRLGKSPLWAALLLLHPTMVIYSRTIMADGAAGTGLLLAGLCLTFPGPLGAIGAGLAVGMAALMRYHAGLMLPIVAACLMVDRGRSRRHRDSFLCFVAGSVVGLMIVGYDIVVYGTILDPFTASRGYFSTAQLPTNSIFYVSALLIIWPLMLPAPLLDRTPIRWLSRAACGFFLATAMLYYFHDRGSSWLETAVLGQRLLQVVLPLWVVTYAIMLDDWIVPTLRRAARGWAWPALVGAACIGLLVANGLVLRKHQRHLDRLRLAREAAIATIPPGSLVVHDGALRKLFGIPIGVPTYRWHELYYGDAVLVEPGDEILDGERSAWFLAVFNKFGGRTLPDAARALIDRYDMTPIPVAPSELILYRTRSRSGPTRPPASSDLLGPPPEFPPHVLSGGNLP